MQLSLVFAPLLCFTTWMSLVQTTPGRVKSCCDQWSKTRIPVLQIMNYTIQSEGACPITAVLFKAVAGKTICSNPNSGWARRAILKVDIETKALQKKGQNEEDEEASASGMKTTASTASKNAPRNNRRNGKRRQRQRNRRRRKGQTKCA
ncbi:C-C motif chemokine 2-like [Embiotoca jacksoni]|uniref:C-C motif chemokine 2-like n=1 Tax=Embiotoca jacksoni TaxID=100190 RepID=UPI0037038BF4